MWPNTRFSFLVYGEIQIFYTAFQSTENPGPLLFSTSRPNRDRAYPIIIELRKQTDVLLSVLFNLLPVVN